MLKPDNPFSAFLVSTISFAHPASVTIRQARQLVRPPLAEGCLRVPVFLLQDASVHGGGEPAAGSGFTDWFLPLDPGLSKDSHQQAAPDVIRVRIRDPELSSTPLHVLVICRRIQVTRSQARAGRRSDPSA